MNRQAEFSSKNDSKTGVFDDICTTLSKLRLKKETCDSIEEEAEAFYDSKEFSKYIFGDENCDPNKQRNDDSTENKEPICDDTPVIEKESSHQVPDLVQSTSTANEEENTNVSDKPQSNKVDDKPPSTESSNSATAEPVKKKRGRKPGSKSTKSTKRTSQKYPFPILKHPEAFSNLIHFDYDDKSVFLRHTSRDVMLSSTMPFQETPEYLELKEAHERQKNIQQRRPGLLYSSLPVSIPYIRTVNIIDYRRK